MSWENVAGMANSRLISTSAAAATVAAIAVSGCGSATPPDSKTTAAPAAHVTSSIAEGADLIRPVRWEARMTGAASDDVASVRFLIDGKVKHVEHEVPYVFAGRGNVLLPGTLKPGSHTFGVDVELADGRRFTTASTATVSRRAMAVPRQLVGRWTRDVTAPEVARTDDFRDASFGDPLPVGAWKLRIGADGTARYVDPTSAHDLTVGQVRFEPAGRVVVGNEIPNFPGASEGGFCPDTVGPGTYRWSIRGGVLGIHVVHDRACADRNSFWNGRFTR